MNNWVLYNFVPFFIYIKLFLSNLSDILLIFSVMKRRFQKENMQKKNLDDDIIDDASNDDDGEI